MRTLVQVCMAVALATIVAACATRYDEAGLQRLFVDKSKSHLLNCAGAPTSQQIDGNQEFLTYSNQFHTGIGGNLLTSTCRMNFTVTDGRVTNVNGSWYGHWANTAEACDRMFAACN